MTVTSSPHGLLVTQYEFCSKGSARAAGGGGGLQALRRAACLLSRQAPELCPGHVCLSVSGALCEKGPNGWLCACLGVCARVTHVHCSRRVGPLECGAGPCLLLEGGWGWGSLRDTSRWVLARELLRTPQAVKSAQELFGPCLRWVLLHTFPRDLPPRSQGPCQEVRLTVDAGELKMFVGDGGRARPAAWTESLESRSGEVCDAVQTFHGGHSGQSAVLLLWAVPWGQGGLEASGHASHPRQWLLLAWDIA